MKNLTENRGIKIDKDVLSFLQKAENKAGSVRKLANLCGVSHVSIGRWLGNVSDRENDCIDWPNWEKVWLYLTKEEIISPDDVRWMPPSILREIMIKMRDIKINGHGNIVSARDAKGNNITIPAAMCDGEIEAFRSALIMELIELDIEMAAKDVVLRTVRNFRRK